LTSPESGPAGATLVVKEHNSPSLDMAQSTLLAPPTPVVIDEETERAIDRLITKTDDPVDDLHSERQSTLLKSPLHCSWSLPALPESPELKRRFWTGVNVGLFETPYLPPLIPDFALAADVSAPRRRNSAYFFWDHGKMPDLVVEIVSNKIGGELGRKKQKYARWGIRFYIVWDPFLELGSERIQFFVLVNGRYRKSPDRFIPELNLGFTIWRGEWEGVADDYLRWCDRDGNLLPTSNEEATANARRADQERRRAEEERRRADQERLRAQEEKRRAEEEALRAELEGRRADQAEAKLIRLREKLRLLGLDPEAD